METVALLGTFPLDAITMFYEQCKGKYNVIEVPTQEEMSLACGAEYLVPRTLNVSQEDFAMLGDQVKLCQRWGVGFESVDIAEATKRGIPVGVTTGVNSQPVAELAVLLMMASYRHLSALTKRAAQGTLKKEDIANDSFLIEGKTVGLVGLGNIGSRVARMVRGMGASVLYYAVPRVTPEMEAELGVTYCPLEQLLEQSDIISLHVPLLPQTEHIINADALRRMKKNALLINSARGGLVDTQALMDALDAGEIWGAALDAVEDEPLPAGHKLYEMDRVIITPHTGGGVCDINDKMVQRILDNVDAVAAGKQVEPMYLVNKDVYSK